MALKNQLYKCFNHWAEEGSVWIISDLHFSEPLEECGFEWKPSDEDMIKIINSCVGKKDTLIVLGDIGNIEPVKKLKGYKVLIKGNHDKGNSYYKREEKYITISDDLTLEQIRKEYPDFRGFMSESFDRVIYTDNCLFDEVYDGPVFINNKIILSHEPIIDDEGCFYNIHGHKHNDKIIKTPYSFNVCADAIHFTPVKLNNLLTSGILKDIKDIHRVTIDNAIERNKLKQDANS